MENMLLPRYYWMRDFSEFEGYIRENGVINNYKAGELVFGTGIFEYMCYVVSGLAKFFVAHDSGKEKTIYYIGPGSMCVLYSPPVKYKLENDGNQVRAVSDIQVINVPQEKVLPMMKNNFEFHRRMTETYVKFSNLLLYESTNQIYNDTITKACNFFYIYVTATGSPNVGFTQDDIASTIGVSRVNLGRALKELRELGMIETYRHYIKVLNMKMLYDYASWDVKDDEKDALKRNYKF